MVVDVAEAVGVVATVVVVGELLSPGGGGGAVGCGKGRGDGEMAGDERVVGQGGVGAVGVLGQRLGKVDGGSGRVVGKGRGCGYGARGVEPEEDLAGNELVEVSEDLLR